MFHQEMWSRTTYFHVERQFDTHRACSIAQQSSVFPAWMYIFIPPKCETYQMSFEKQQQLIKQVETCRTVVSFGMKTPHYLVYALLTALSKSLVFILKMEYCEPFFPIK